MHATIYHNPSCGTSRNTLALIRHAGIEPRVIEYLKDTPSRDELLALVRDAGIGVRDAIRAKEAKYAGLGLDDPALSDDALLDARLAEPVLINRPFVRTDLAARLSRPSETVLDILPRTRAPFTKEDGGVVAPKWAPHHPPPRTPCARADSVRVAHAQPERAARLLDPHRIGGIAEVGIAGQVQVLAVGAVEQVVDPGAELQAAVDPVADVARGRSVPGDR